MLKNLPLAILALLVLAPAVDAQASGQAGSAGNCLPGAFVAVLGVLNAGNVMYCVWAHDAGRIGDVVNIGAAFSGPLLAAPGAAPVFTTIIESGCTISGPQTVRTSLVGATFQSMTQGLAVTDTTCSGAVRLQLAVTIPAVTFFDVELPFTIHVRDDSTDLNLSGAIDVANTGTITVQDDADGWAIHQDEACGATTPCQVNGTVMSQISVGGNFTQNNTFPDSITVSLGNTVGGLPVFDFGLLLFWVAALLFFSYQRWLFALGFSIPGLLDVFFPADIPGDFTQWFIFCLFGVLLEIAANRFGWGPYRRPGQIGS